MRHIFVVDPSLFTIPYDVALCNGLSDVGVKVELFGRPLRQLEELGPTRFAFLPFFYRWTDQKRGLGSIRLMAKACEYIVDTTRFLSVVRRRKPQVVHVQWSAMPLIDAIIFKLLRRSTKVVLTVHDSEPFNGRASSPLQMLGYFNLLNSADALIVHTADARMRLVQQGLSERRISIVAHGLLGETPRVAQNAATGRPVGKMRILLFGRLKPYKGVDVLIEALGQLPQDVRAQLEVTVAGEAFFDMAPLRARASELGLDDCVDINEGYLSEEQISSLVQTADLLIFPYRQIDASGVLFMAMNYRKPILASRMGAFADIVTDCGNGALVEPGNAEELARELATIVREPDLLARMIQSANSIDLDRFSWDKVAESTLAVYDGIERR